MTFGQHICAFDILAFTANIVVWLLLDANTYHVPYDPLYFAVIQKVKHTACLMHYEEMDHLCDITGRKHPSIHTDHQGGRWKTFSTQCQ